MSIIWEAGGREIVGSRRAAVMGVVNVTPDSFSDGVGTVDHAAAIARGLGMVAEGAVLLDVGGESSRPGAEPVRVGEELRRILPVIEALAASEAAISIDTTKAEVARQALKAGATVINDITGLEGDPEMARVLAGSDAGVVLMHMAGTPRTMQIDPSYDDVVAEVFEYLARRVERVEAQGVARNRIAIDPGIGFGKTSPHNVELLRNLGRFASLGCAVLVGISRKGLLGTLTGRQNPDRMTGSIVASLAALARGARVVRVHDVGPMVDAIKVWDALQGWDEP